MAIEFARVRYVKRSDGGNVCRSAAYNARADLACERTGERFYFAHRDGVLHRQVLLPQGAAERFLDIETLWNAAQKAEKRKDSQEARELLLALPSDPGLDLEDWRVLVEEFATEHFVSKGVAVQVDIHAPPEGDRNVHAHLLITTRRLEGEAFAAAKARDLDPEVRTGRNGRPIVAEGELWGALWRDHQNRYFEREGLALRVDETGVVPQRHEGPIRLRAVPEQAQARAEANDELNETAVRDPEQVLAALTRRRATFTELDVERQLRKHVPDQAERIALRSAIMARPEVVALHDRQDGAFTGRFTTEAVRAEEEALLRNAASISRQGRGVAPQQVAAAAAARTLDDEQHEALLRATGTDGLVVIEGIAGAGKSYSVEAIREAHERSGWRVIGLAPTNTVAADMRRSGFRHGSTVHLELFYQENGRYDRAPAWNRQTCVIVDEAAMLDTKIFARLMHQAAEAKAKVVLVGDDRQLASVERGGMYTELKQRHGSAVISKVRRQEADWQRAASEDFAAGRVGEGLRAYAEHDCLHWSDGLEEARTRLLSDWDQSSRERPDVNRFVYASTNVEVNRLNQDIRDIRVRRGEVGQGIPVETTRGAFEIGIGDRIQFFGNDRKAGFYNGTLGTVTAVERQHLAVVIDSGRAVRVDTEAFNQFGLGYAGTVYRGQGKTQCEVQALYDNAFSWNARTAYVGMTRHKETVQLYVPTSLAADELALARQMGRTMRDEASMAYATAAEVIPLAARQQPQPQSSTSGTRPSETRPSPKAEGGQQDRPAPSARPADPASSGRLPQVEIAALRKVDMTAYARDVHGFAVRPDPQRDHHYELTRATPEGGFERLEVKYVPGGHWTYRNPANPRDRGDILDFAKREGAPDLAGARLEIEAYLARGSEPMREPLNKRKQAEDQPRANIDPNAPDAAERQAFADEQRRRDLAGADVEDRQDAIGREAEQREADFRAEQARQDQWRKEEAEKQDRLETERREVGEAEQDRLRAMQQTRPADHDSYVAYSGQRAEQARQETGIRGPEETGRSQAQPPGDQAAYPASASLRYTESLARHYDARDPYNSLSRASLAESAQFQREQYELNRQIALEGDPNRRDMLAARRDIEHNDYMAQAWDRVAGQSQAITGNPKDPYAQQQREKAEAFRSAARDGRAEWAERSVDQPGLYPPLNEQMRAQVEAARQEKDRQAELQAKERQQQAEPDEPGLQPGVDRRDAQTPAPDPSKARETPRQGTDQAPDRPAEPRQPPARDQQQAPRSVAEETRAMERMNLPEYAAEKHGYAVEWKDRAQNSRAILHKGDDELRAAKREDGSWTYANRHNASDRGDIVDFEAQRGAGSRSAARDNIRPDLERVEQQLGRRLDHGRTQQGQAQNPERGQERAADGKAEMARQQLRNAADYQRPPDTGRDGPER